MDERSITFESMMEITVNTTTVIYLPANENDIVYVNNKKLSVVTKVE